jgi:glyoxylase-like metal-dependent hydrolase (beta-lactamase superfamily II)
MFKEGDLRRRAFLRTAAIGVAATQFGVFGTARAQSDQSKPDEDTTTSAVTTLPDYAPVPRSAIGPTLNDQGYYVGRVERNLYWVTDGVYQSAFLTTRDGVVLFDAPATIGRNLQRAVDEIAAANGVSNKVTHLVRSHHHADHAGGSSLFRQQRRAHRARRDATVAVAGQRSHTAGAGRDVY